MENGSTANTQNSFTYKGLTFVPYKKLKGQEADFHAISKKLRDIKITPHGWDWNEFYKAAKSSSAKNLQFDLFICNGQTVIPCSRILFAYKE